MARVPLWVRAYVGKSHTRQKVQPKARSERTLFDWSARFMWMVVRKQPSDVE
jgi:hypothetical protein